MSLRLFLVSRHCLCWPTAIDQFLPWLFGHDAQYRPEDDDAATAGGAAKALIMICCFFVLTPNMMLPPHSFGDRPTRRTAAHLATRSTTFQAAPAKHRALASPTPSARQLYFRPEAQTCAPRGAWSPCRSRSSGTPCRNCPSPWTWLVVVSIPTQEACHKCPSPWKCRTRWRQPRRQPSNQRRIRRDTQ